jgi:uncharacterized protein (TIGR02147 family)
MKEQLAFQKMLLTKYEELRSKNSKFSRRAFARKLGISSGAISEIVNGQRKISLKLAGRISARLGLDPQERSEVLSIFKSDSDSAVALRQKKAYLQLSADQFRLIADWYHFGILTLMRTQSFKSDRKWIASRLGLPQSGVDKAIDRMKRLGLVSEDRRGWLSRSKEQYRTSDDIANASIRSAHKQYLDKAKESLDRDAVIERDFSSTMITMNLDKLDRAKEVIRKFQDELTTELEAEPGSEVYQLCVQLFPLSKKI